MTGVPSVYIGKIDIGPETIEEETWFEQHKTELLIVAGLAVMLGTVVMKR